MTEETFEDTFTRRAVTVVMCLIAALAFVFSFGNVWALSLRLGIPGMVAPLIAPMVDLSVIGLLVGLRYLALRGTPAAELASATRLLHFSGFLTLALNVAEPLIAKHYGKAAVDAVAPLLLIGWGHVGPQMLGLFHGAVARRSPRPPAVRLPVPVAEPAPEPAPEPEPAAGTRAESAPTPEPVPVSDPVPDPEPTPDRALAPVAEPAPVSAPEQVVEPKPEPARARVAAPARKAGPAPNRALVDAARRMNEQHRASHGEPMSLELLRSRLGVAPPLVAAVHAEINA